jgi:2-oxoglutarate dehydrogenase E1 component
MDALRADRTPAFAGVEQDTKVDKKNMSDALSFLSAANADYIGDLYARYRKNPGAVDASWADLFSGLGEEGQQILAELKGASWRPDASKLAAVLSTPANETEAKPAAKKDDKKGVPAAALDSKAAQDTLRAFLLIRSYQVRGHLMATLDPLGLMERKYHPELDPATYGFGEGDLDRPVMLGGILGLERATLRQVLNVVQETYCGTIGMEFMHIQDPEQKAWLQQKLESPRPAFSADEKKNFLKRLTAAEGFERFLDVKYTGTKRFGVEGGDVTIPAIEEIIARSAQLGVKEAVLGMAHRGRLNVLTNVMGKSFTAMFSEFQGTPAKPDDVQGSGDVKYHMGTSSDRDFGGNTVHLSLTPNPSHLEFVDPVVVGKVRAKQAIRKDNDRQQVMALLIHGDAALSGQGIVPETLMMSDLPGYRVGGTMHVVINNQIGFTTAPLYSRSGNYCTDVAKMVQSPVFHVNGDDVEAVIFVSRIAAEFRQQFRKDVFVDIICYRRHGHNESDEPAFTQPAMYKVIREKPTVRDVYAQRLVSEGSLTQDEADQVYKDWNAYLEIEFQAATSYKPNRADMLEGEWSGLKQVSSDRRGATGISPEMAKRVGKAITSVPAGFDLNPKIARQLEAKKKMFESGEGFDWATGEALAFGSLALEGYRVRLSGQDCGRGTFSQRHAALTDQSNEFRYIPLNDIDPSQAKFEVHDSPLSEAAVLGFEYGYSTANPRSLVLWEGQFGDFVNGAQVIIDQFICSAETKWLRMSGLVLLLPHGMEGQGPEHSSGRLERFLQNCAEDNWQVVNCSTPANYFHALRRQMHREFRKPLIVMTPKSLLRHKMCVSSLKMMTGKENFHRVLYEDTPPPAKDIRRVVLCSGKVYYDLLEAREKKGVKDVVFVRLEQFYPFPDDALGEELKKYPNADSVIWCQEEPENQGAWTFVDRRIEGVLKAIKHKAQRPAYVGRPAAAAPATGSLKTHNKEQDALLTAALTI